MDIESFMVFSFVFKIQTIEKSLSKLVSKQRMTQEEADVAISLVSTSISREAAADADLVIEAIPEVPELKFSAFKELDSICKESAILASNTSSISINDIADSTNRPERVIGMHFMNPVPIMKLVEIINGSETDPEVTSAILTASEKMGKTPLQCNDSPGFISNRILCPMLNEAILAFQEGVAEPEAIDGIMKLDNSGESTTFTGILAFFANIEMDELTNESSVEAIIIE